MQVVFLAPPKVHLLDMSGPAHVFYEAQEKQPDISLHFISLDEKVEIESSSGLFFSHLIPYHRLSLSKDDLLFIPGLDASLLLDDDFNHSIKPFLVWIKQQHANGAVICSICTGTFLLAETGLLDGLSCTTHWKYRARFAEKFPKIDLLNNRLFVENNNIYSSAGVSSGIDLALFLLEKIFGTYFASQIAREVVVYLRRSQEDPQLSVFLQYRNHQENRVHEVQNVLSQNLSSGINIDKLAEKVNTSPRNLTRLFKKTTGITIGKYTEKLRIETAIKLLDAGAKVVHAANECGFKSTNQLRKILNKYPHLLPKKGL